ncbi:MAG: helix-turn-helix domain-containing protein [Gammaproteobacteria bacterium]|nr:helix-turn-helix domain-containing protein [Gammaproteobacteria bacterium]
MDLLSQFLSSLTVSSTSISTWRFYPPCGVRIENFKPGFLLSHVSGDALHIHTQQEAFTLERGDLFVAPLGGDCTIGFADTRVYTPINKLEWQGVGAETYDIADHHTSAMSVSLGKGNLCTALLGIAFSLKYTQTLNVASSLPQFIQLKSASNPLYQVITPAIDVLVSDNKAGYFGMATKLAEFAVISSIRAYILSEPDFPIGVFRGMSNQMLNKALYAIQTHPEKAWSVQQLADHCAMSRSNFAARFSEEIGKTPIEYLNEVRVQLARQLLSESNHSLAYIAERTGFNSDRVFRNVFYKVMHMTPRDYRKQTRQEGHASAV